MSFAQFDVEAQRPPRTSGLGLAETSSQLMEFASSVAAFCLLVSQVGGTRDNDKLRARIETALGECNRHEAQATRALELADASTDASQRLVQEKLKRELGAVEATLARAQNDWADKKQAYPSYEQQRLADPQNGHPNAETQPLLALQTQLYTELDEADLAYQTELVRAREAELGRIQTGIQEVNTIFRDLSQLVKQQGELVDTVEGNMEDILQNTGAATQELATAAKQQRAKGKWCCLMLVGLSVFLIIVLALAS